MKIVAIIQARMASTRLPGKVLAQVSGVPLIEILLRRLKKVEEIDLIVVATTINSADDILVKWLYENNYLYFRGSENDVLDRFLQAAKKYEADIIIRVTADDPLKDPEIIQKAINIFKNIPNIDYVSNTIEPTYPEGLDIEIFNVKALIRAEKESVLNSDREHVTSYIWKNPNSFRTFNFTADIDRSNLRLTVDKLNDLTFIRKLLEISNNDFLINYKNIIEILDKNTYLSKINQGTARNEGYLNSLKKE